MSFSVKDRGRNNEIVAPLGTDRANLRVDVVGNENRIRFEPGAVIHGTKISIRGDGNVLHFGRDATLGSSEGKRPQISIAGNANALLLGARCTFAAEVVIESDEGTIDVGDMTICGKSVFRLVDASTISLGRHCRVGTASQITDGFMHPFFEENGLNTPDIGGHVAIGERVWLKAQVQVFGFSSIGADSVVTAASCVVGALPERCLAGGAPAHVLEEDLRRICNRGRSAIRISGVATGTAQLGDKSGPSC